MKYVSRPKSASVSIWISISISPIFWVTNIDIVSISTKAISTHFYRVMHMHKRGICCHPVSVCASVTFVSCAKTNKDIFEICSPSGSDTTLVFPYQRRCRYSDGNPHNGGVKYKRVWKIADFFHEYLAVSQKRLYLDGHMQRENL